MSKPPEFEAYTPEELEQEKSRIISDAELLKKGARYVQDLGTDKPRLEITKQQLDEIKQRKGERKEIKTKSGKALVALILSEDWKAYGMIADPEVDIDATDDDETTPLMAAIKTGSFTLVRDVLKRKPDVNAVDRFGNTALYYAIKSKDAHFISLLRRHGAKQ